MKERLLDVVKWGLILVMAGAVFYAVCPKYEFKQGNRTERLKYRCNKVTGKVEAIDAIVIGLEEATGKPLE